ncbi:MAG: hypothetical protein ACI94Y_003855 [Maribacter sp.]|jgi:hypothetical protein
MYKNLSCPNCEEKILYNDINIDKGLAKCSQCHVLFNIENEVGVAPKKAEIFVIPKGIEVLKMFSELEIKIDWRHTASKFLMFFTLVWNGILFPMALVIIISGETEVLLFMSIHLAIGLGFLYWSLAALFNTSYITVDSHYINIQHRPFQLFFKEHQLETNDIEQLYVKKYSNGSTNGNPNYVYSVVAIMKSKEEIKIIKGVNKPQQALYIEQEIEKFANIKDKPIAGEI